VTAPATKRGFDWEAAGHELGAKLDGYHSIVVIGADPVATGKVAVGIARVQGIRRRTAVGDLFAESPPIQALVPTDDPHGLVDTFVYGVSINRIAHPVPDAGELYVLPSGTEPPEYEEILPSPRWARLAAGFAEVGALLVLAAPASAPRIEDLVAAADGAIVVGDVAPRKLPVASVVYAVREPRSTVPVRSAAATAKKPWWRHRAPAAAGIGLTLVAAGVAAWLAYRPLAGGPARLGSRPDSSRRAAGAGVIHTDSAAAADSLTDTTSASVPSELRISNPQDSAQASPFAVELLAANTQAGAILKLQQDGSSLPAPTFSPALVQGAQWYKVIAGAYGTRFSADSLLTALRRRKVVDAGSGTVVRLPLAFRIDSAVPSSAVPGLLEAYLDRGQPVYALRQADGTAWLLAGAFASIEQSTLYAASLRASGITPVLVYRKGRIF
jgi:hypothetical protein